MQDSTLLAIVSVLSITILQSIALCMFHLDGALLSGAVGAIVAISLKRQEFNEYYGRIKSYVRSNNRGVSSPS